MEHVGAQGNAVEVAGQGVEGALAQCRTVLPDGAQGRSGITAHGDVIIAQNADILRNTQSQFVAVEQDAVS